MDSSGSPGGRPERAPATDAPPDHTNTQPPADTPEASAGQTPRPAAVDTDPDPAGSGAAAGPPRVPRPRRSPRRTGTARGTTASTPRPRRSSRSDRVEQAIREQIARLVADAPPLSPETRARLAELFSVTHRTRHRP